VNWRSLSLTLVVLCAPVLIAAQRHGEHQMTHDASEYAKRLDDPLRDSWQKPHEVVTALALKPEEVVADIGAGTGYFSKRFAHHAGRVFAVDIDPKLLQMASTVAPANMSTILAASDDPKLQPGSVDTVFFCDVLHHIEGRAAYLKKVRAALKAGGRLVVIDFQKRETPVGPGLAMRIAEADMIREVEAAGFVKFKEFAFLPYQYFLEFRRD